MTAAKVPAPPRAAIGSAGLRAIELTGGIEHAVFGLKAPATSTRRCRARGSRKTYGQLADGLRTDEGRPRFAPPLA